MLLTGWLLSTKTVPSIPAAYLGRACRRASQMVVFRDFRETFDRFFDWDRPLSTNLAELFCLAAA
jgi:hypothetical protein